MSRCANCFNLWLKLRGGNEGAGHLLSLDCGLKLFANPYTAISFSPGRAFSNARGVSTPKIPQLEKVPHSGLSARKTLITDDGIQYLRVHLRRSHEMTSGGPKSNIQMVLSNRMRTWENLWLSGCHFWWPLLKPISCIPLMLYMWPEGWKSYGVKTKQNPL